MSWSLLSIGHCAEKRRDKYWNLTTTPEPGDAHFTNEETEAQTDGPVVLEVAMVGMNVNILPLRLHP